MDKSWTDVALVIFPWIGSPPEPQSGLLFIGYGFFKNGVIGNAVLLVYTGAVAGTDNRGRSRVKTHPLPGRLRA